MVTRWKSTSGCFSNSSGRAVRKAASKASAEEDGTLYHRFASPQWW